MKIVRYTFMLFMGLFLTTACSSEDERADVHRMPIHISIPADDMGGITRAPGDPGNYEHFALPKYLRLYLVEDNGTSQKVVTILTEELDDGWVKEKQGTDSIYTYGGGLTMQLDPLRSGTARIYALLSSVELEINTAITENSSTEENVMDMTFDLPSSLPSGYSNYGEVVRNIYSSPYNLKRTNGDYYGTVQDYENDMPYVNIVLYHIASKLDVIWNVAEDKQSSVRLNQLNVTGLKKTGCLAFMPMENNTVPTSGTYDESINIDVGAQWYGRHSFYVIPYNDNNNNYPVNLSLYKNGNALTADKTVTIQAEYKSGTPANDIFTPWIVAPLQITTDLTQ